MKPNLGPERLVVEPDIETSHQLLFVGLCSLKFPIKYRELAKKKHLSSLLLSVGDVQSFAPGSLDAIFVICQSLITRRLLYLKAHTKALTKVMMQINLR